MRQRCDNPCAAYYHIYGGRGITYCERWREFANFLADMGARPSSRHSLDRINNDGNYEPGNCRWATPQEQALNSRKVKRILVYEDALYSVRSLARKFDIPPLILNRKLKLGLDVQQALDAAIKSHSAFMARKR